MQEEICVEKADSSVSDATGKASENRGHPVPFSRDDVRPTALPIAVSLLVFPVLTSILGAFGLLAWMPITAIPALIGLVASLGSAWFLGHAVGRSWPVLAWVSGTLLAVLLFGTFKLTDSERDSKTIDKPATIFLAAGWNPLVQSEPHRLGAVFGVPESAFDGPACVFLPKAQVIVAASLYRLTGNVDVADGIGLLFMVALFWTAWACFPYLYAIHERWSLALALLLVLNPVALRQLTCGHSDGLLGLVLVTGVLAVAAYDRTHALQLLALSAGCFVYGVNLVVGGPLFFVVAYLVVGVYHGVHQFKERMLDRDWVLAGLLALVLAVVCGISPYVLNVARGDAPFLPRPAVEGTRLSQDAQRFGLSQDAEQMGYSGLFFHAYFPGGKRMQRLRSELMYDKSLEPFSWIDYSSEPGETFKWALLLGVVAVIFRLRVDAVVAALMLSIAAQPNAWHLRMVPQIWAIPVVICGALGADWTGRGFRPICTGLLVMALWWPIAEVGKDLVEMARGCAGLPSVVGLGRCCAYTQASVPAQPRQYTLYWWTLMRDLGMGAPAPLADEPVRGEAVFSVFDLKVYPPAGTEVAPPSVGRGVGVLLKRRMIQLCQTRWFVLPRPGGGRTD